MLARQYELEKMPWLGKRRFLVHRNREGSGDEIESGTILGCAARLSVEFFT
jgi:hypothetical protein